MSSIQCLMHGYAVNTGTRPSLYLRPQTEAEQKEAPHNPGVSTSVETTVHDARDAGMKLDTHSFELVTGPVAATKLSLSDLRTGTNDAHAAYGQETKTLIKAQTGAAEVLLLGGPIIRSSQTESTSDEDEPAPQRPAGGIHTDSSAFSAEKMFQTMMLSLSAEDRAKYSTGRFIYVGTWRSIGDVPVENAHLAMLDQNSVAAPDDYIEADLHGQGYDIVQYRLNARNAKAHKWWYFPAMSSDEVLLLKHFDSDLEVSGRVCFHSSVDDLAKSDQSVPPRTSIEIRALAFFPDHTPNTCPPLEDEGDDEEVEGEAPDEAVVSSATDKVLTSLQSLQYWPATGKSWLVSTYGSGAPSNVNAVLVQLLQDSTGHFGLRRSSASTKAAVKKALLGKGVAEVIKRAVEQVKRSKSSSAGVLGFGKQTERTALVGVACAAVGVLAGWFLRSRR